MSPTTRNILFIVVLSILTRLLSAGAPTSFCKCTCFSNSTIIPLDAPILTEPESGNSLFIRSPYAHPDDDQDDSQEPVPDPPPSSDKDEEKEEDPGSDEDRKEYRAGNCNDCNRQFCLDYNLPICKKASMEDVFTTCFQRDSRKDQAVVFIFIFATAGLLIWAAVKPWMGKWFEAARGGRNYNLVSGTEN